MAYTSIFGKKFGYDDSGLLFNGTPLLAGQPRFNGRDIYVDSVTGQATGRNGRSAAQAVSTIAAAVALCRANKGDRIIVAAGHAESLASATALAIATAGIQIIGLGSGTNRPTLTFTTANTATIAVSAADVSFENILFIANFLSIAAAFTLTTAKGFRLINCGFRDTSSVLNFLNIVKSTGAANTVDHMVVEDCTWNGLGTTSVNSFILTANDIDGARWRRNHVKLARTATAAIFGTVTAGVLTDLIANDNVAISQQTADTGGAFISVGGTTSTGIVARNIVGDLSTTDLFMTTSVGVTFVDNRKTGVISASGYPLPALDS